ncbi:MAG: hypothetical protein Q9217_002750 [Psora testacea]
MDQLIAVAPTQIVISPGPGTPETDAGISTEAIKYFAGKIPVLGVCLGEQCIFTAWGGKVEKTGDILHGKTSLLCHDSKGVFAGLPQQLPVTRYHSLAATHITLPKCLEVTAWIAAGEDQKGTIMGIRHRELLVEGVQFHPESILTSMGQAMLRNFLNMRGGTWRDNELWNKNAQVTSPVNMNRYSQDSYTGVRIPQSHPSEPGESVLDRIYRHRQQAVKAQQAIPSRRLSDLQAAYHLSLAPPQISFVDRLKKSPWSIALMAEFKRASPSKGDISLDACAPEIARKYALAGASVISVLTEPNWFKGTIDDLRLVRQSLDGMPNRPAILRKEFIFDEYQILEARLNGADSVLLIVKMLDEGILRRLYSYSLSLSMDPLVEVNNAKEMEIAKSLGAKLIGINNRSLDTFEVNLKQTTQLLAHKPEGSLLCALSGISSPSDIKDYKERGVNAVLIGEALMHSTHVNTFVDQLFGNTPLDSAAVQAETPDILVKICGVRSCEAATAAIEAGADFVSIILVQGRKRCVSESMGLAISKIVHGKPHTKHRLVERYNLLEYDSDRASDYFSQTSDMFRYRDRALLCGVFQDQPLSHILAQQSILDLDVIQLHGSEPVEWASLIPVPVIRRFSPDDPGLGRRGYFALPLLDSTLGGTGHRLDLGAVTKALNDNEGLQIMLAGGLRPENVEHVLNQLGSHRSKVVGVDISSGLEEDGVQNLDRIRQSFLQQRKDQFLKMSALPAFLTAPPTLCLLASIATCALVLGLTAPTSLIRPAALPLMLSYVYFGACVSSAESFSHPLYANLTGGSLAGMLFKYVDLVLLSAWSAEAKGPTSRNGGLEPVQAAEENHAETSRAVFGGHIAHVARGVWWALTLIFNSRLIETEWEVKHVPPFSAEQTGWVPTRARFVLSSLAKALVCFVLLDATRLLAAPSEQNAMLFASERVAFFSRLRDVSTEEVIVRYFSAIMFGIVTYLLFQGVHCGMGAVMVGLGVSEVKMWRPCFGNLSESWSLRRFWGVCWHQGLRQTLNSPAGFATYRLLGFKRGGLLGRYLRVVLIFLLSGVLHKFGDIAAGLDWQDSGVIQYFGTQALGILTENYLHHVAVRNGREELH